MPPPTWQRPVPDRCSWWLIHPYPILATSVPSFQGQTTIPTALWIPFSLAMSDVPKALHADILLNYHLPNSEGPQDTRWIFCKNLPCGKSRLPMPGLIFNLHINLRSHKFPVSSSLLGTSSSPYFLWFPPRLHQSHCSNNKNNKTAIIVIPLEKNFPINHLSPLIYSPS